MSNWPSRQKWKNYQRPITIAKVKILPFRTCLLRIKVMLCIKSLGNPKMDILPFLFLQIQKLETLRSWIQMYKFTYLLEGRCKVQTQVCQNLKPCPLPLAHGVLGRHLKEKAHVSSTAVIWLKENDLPTFQNMEFSMKQWLALRCLGNPDR